MNKPPPATNFTFPLFIASLILAAPFFLACSDDPVHVSSTQSYLVLDWPDEESFPSQRLSVFVELGSNARRVERLSIKHGDYVWNVESPILIQSAGRQWAGSSRLEPPQGINGAAGVFEAGDYFVECVDAAGKSSEGTFFVAYDKSLLETLAADLPQKLPAVRERLAVYSESNELLYYDVRNDKWYDDAMVFKGVKNSSFYRKALMSGTVVCFEPKIFKDGEKSDESE